MVIETYITMCEHNSFEGESPTRAYTQVYIDFFGSGCLNARWQGRLCSGAPYRVENPVSETHFVFLKKQRTQKNVEFLSFFIRVLMSHILHTKDIQTGELTSQCLHILPCIF